MGFIEEQNTQVSLCVLLISPSYLGKALASLIPQIQVNLLPRNF